MRTSCSCPKPPSVAGFVSSSLCSAMRLITASLSTASGGGALGPVGLSPNRNSAACCGPSRSHLGSFTAVSAGGVLGALARYVSEAFLVHPGHARHRPPRPAVARRPRALGAPVELDPHEVYGLDLETPAHGSGSELSANLVIEGTFAPKRSPMLGAPWGDFGCTCWAF